MLNHRRSLTGPVGSTQTDRQTDKQRQREREKKKERRDIQRRREKDLRTRSKHTKLKA